MRTVFCVLLLGAVALVAAPDVNVTGKWSGSFKMTRSDGETSDGPALLSLKQTGSEITGTVGQTEDEQHAITKGKIEGEKITLLIEDEARTIKFALVVAADRITGDAEISYNGETAKAKIEVTRAK
jgi:hypothetical protein